MFSHTTSQLPILKPGDTVEIIAPASRCSDKHLMGIKEILLSWGLNCLVDDNIFGDDLLCAHRDEQRFIALKNAIENPEVSAVICARGGYGSMRLIPALKQINPPVVPKMFVGMSDITALQLYFQQHWGWPTIHGALAEDKFSPESIAALRSLLFGESETIEFMGIPLNAQAQQNYSLKSTIVGGNLCLVQSSIGTDWQIDGDGKIIFLEEVGERGYRIDRMLEHLSQANIFKHATAILLGDFLGGEEPNGTSLIQPVLNRFAEQCNIPVVQIAGIGHGYTNFPIPLGTAAQLNLGHKIKLRCTR